MSTKEKINKELTKIEDKDKKVKQFSDLLNSIESLEDKRKFLWKEIYENAVKDRECASFLFADLFKELTGSAQHAVTGSIAAKYLERMSKSNDQILKLAELISKAEEDNSKIDTEDIYSTIMG
jgi:hypothetical protein